MALAALLFPLPAGPAAIIAALTALVDMCASSSSEVDAAELWCPMGNCVYRIERPAGADWATTCITDLVSRFVVERLPGITFQASRLRVRISVATALRVDAAGADAAGAPNPEEAEARDREEDAADPSIRVTAPVVMERGKRDSSKLCDDQFGIGTVDEHSSPAKRRKQSGVLSYFKPVPPTTTK